MSFPLFPGPSGGRGESDPSFPRTTHVIPDITNHVIPDITNHVIPDITNYVIPDIFNRESRIGNPEEQAESPRT